MDFIINRCPQQTQPSCLCIFHKPHTASGCVLVRWALLIIFWYSSVKLVACFMCIHLLTYPACWFVTICMLLCNLAGVWASCHCSSLPNGTRPRLLLDGEFREKMTDNRKSERLREQRDNQTNREREWKEEERGKGREKAKGSGGRDLMSDLQGLADSENWEGTFFVVFDRVSKQTLVLNWYKTT